VAANGVRTGVLIGAASVILGIATTAALASLSAQPGLCAAPALPGTVVDVTFTDSGAMMGPGMHGGPMMGGGHMGMGMGMMSLTASPAAVPAGQVSLRAINRGALAHEVVVLPLGPGVSTGQRPVGVADQVDETGSLGEAATTCGSGEGEGIAPGAVGWATLTLPPGRYELLCNIAGHYRSGMYTELDVLPAR
jgi:uncharacterized cupredoxin-like copper-binding protein